MAHAVRGNGVCQCSRHVLLAHEFFEPLGTIAARHDDILAGTGRSGNVGAGQLIVHERFLESNKTASSNCLPSTGKTQFAACVSGGEDAVATTAQQSPAAGERPTAQRDDRLGLLRFRPDPVHSSPLQGPLARRRRDMEAVFANRLLDPHHNLTQS